MSIFLKASLLLWVYLSLLSLSLIQNCNGLEEEEERKNLRAPTSGQRPVMHTYYMKKLEHLENEWDTEEHLDMMHMWKNSWEAAGWETRILTDEDAKKHPKFDEFEAMLQKLKISTYNHYCFHRWLAMAVIGGGWMSDYDVVPLSMTAEWEEKNRPESDKFHSYASAVPCLLYGSSEEWDRMATAIMQYVPEHEGGHFSDMKALIRHVRDHPYSINREDTVGTRLLVLPDMSIDCNAYKGNTAWHFSHYASHVALQEGIIKEPKPPPKSRAWYMRRFMKDFKFQCFVDQ